MDEGLKILDWPARSPDLNPIENLWGQMVSQVYENARTFDQKDDLKDAIMYAWDNTDKSYMQTLIGSMPNRCAEVNAKRGGKTHYQLLGSFIQGVTIVVV